MLFKPQQTYHLPFFLNIAGAVKKKSTGGTQVFVQNGIRKNGKFLTIFYK